MITPMATPAFQSWGVGLWGQPAAHLVARSLDGGVVLDLPQLLAEPFPLVGLAKLLLGLLVREEVLGAQECRLVGPEKKDLVFVGC